jgi:hypothetical protein
MQQVPWSAPSVLLVTLLHKKAAPSVPCALRVRARKGVPQPVQSVVWAPMPLLRVLLPVMCAL